MISGTNDSLVWLVKALPLGPQMSTSLSLREQGAEKVLILNYFFQYLL